MTRKRASCIRCGAPVVGRGLCSYHYHKRRTADHAAGTFESRYIPNTEVLQHFAALRAAGIGMPRIAELSGVCRMTVEHLADPKRRSVKRRVAEMILAVPLPVCPHGPQLAAGARIPSIGATRRVRALCAIGHSRTYVVGRLGLGDPRMLPLAKLYQGALPGVTVARAREVAALYAELEVTPGPCNQSRRYAEKQGWHPPQVWDEYTIDDPAAEPNLAALRGSSKVGVLDDFREEYVDLRDHVLLPDELIADRLGITYDTLVSRLSRVGIRTQQALAGERAAS